MNNNATKFLAKSDVESNLYVVRTMFIGTLVLILMCMMNELGFYHADLWTMRIATGMVCLLTLLMEVFVHIPFHQNMPATKYIIITGTFLITLCETSVLSFFSLPLLVYPLLSGTHYYSRRINAYAIFCTCLCSILSPWIGYRLDTWDIKYFVWVLHTINPNLLTQDIIDTAMAGTPMADTTGIFTFVALPNFFACIALGVLSYTVNISRRRRQETEVNTILEMQDRMIYSMADIIENRDFDTGGHVKRTSELIRIMVSVIKEHPIKGYENLSDEFYNALIKGAPLHDLGKITISDVILCKPGRLTEEEFEKIKSHPVQSAKIIDQVLYRVGDDFLLETAKNIALYHHEKYNGSGYPDKLSGDSIPLEARLMAIADVFDALVSERCYKEPMSFKEAHDEIVNGMGSHFDPKLMECFELSYPQFITLYKQ